MGSWGTEDSWQGGGWWTRWSHICLQIIREEHLGKETDHATQGLEGNKPVGVATAGKIPQPHRRVL